MNTEHCDLVIVGGGPAGLSAAVSAASEGLSVKVITETLGGQAALSPRIENYLGFPDGITGEALATIAEAQAEKFGAECLVPHLVVDLKSTSDGIEVTLDDGTLVQCKTALLAMGARYKRLDVPGADRLTGHGIYYGSALTVASTLEGRQVAVVGGANSAAQSVLYLARFASEVHILVRGEGIHAMSQYLIQRIEAQSNVTVHSHTEVMAVSGKERVERVLLTNGEVSTLDVDGLFVFIGATPPTKWLRGVVELDKDGFIRTDAELETSVPGVFAAGDVREGSVKRAASAAGEGAMAVQHIHRYLANHGV